MNGVRAQGQGEAGPLARLGGGFARLAEAVMPDPWVLALLLTLVAGVAALAWTPTRPLALVRMWADGLFGFLAFAMQMALVLVGGHAIATAPGVRRGLDRLGGWPRTPAAAVALTAVVAGIAGWVNWGLGLVVGAFLAREVARQGERRGLPLHYPLLGAAGYLGMLVWHGGLSGSAPLLMASADRTLLADAPVVPVGETLFSPMNLLASGLTVALAAGLLARMSPARVRPFSTVVPRAQSSTVLRAVPAGPLHWGVGAVLALAAVGWAVWVNLEAGRRPLWTMAAVDAVALVAVGREVSLRLGSAPGAWVRSVAGAWVAGAVAGAGVAGLWPLIGPAGGRGLAVVGAALGVGLLVARLGGRDRVAPAEALDGGRVLLLAFGGAALGYVQWRFAGSGFALDLNLMILAFLAVGMLLWDRPVDYLGAVSEAVPGTTGILLQFPFYAGILALLRDSGLLTVVTEGLVSVASPLTFPLVAMTSAAVVNLFVPSGGGQWAVQGPIVLEAAQGLGVPAWKAVMAVSYGDQLTNMLQPFWALPLLAITGLKARDVVGYTGVVMVAAALIQGAALALF